MELSRFQRESSEVTQMALKDYRAMDENDYYGQGFSEEGFVSIWLGVEDTPPEQRENIDVLQDLCGVGFYDHDFTESNSFNFQLVAVEQLLEGDCDADSFKNQAIQSARHKGIEAARYVFLQFDFAYNPSRVKRPIANDPVFIGVFPYSED